MPDKAEAPEPVLRQRQGSHQSRSFPRRPGRQACLCCHVCSTRPDIPRHNGAPFPLPITPPPPHPPAPPRVWPEPCGTTRSYLAGGDPGPAMGDGKAEPGGSGRKVPLGSFLCGPLCFLSGCHLPKVMALWGTGAGR